MTVFKDERERSKCALDIATKGYTIVKLALNSNIDRAVKELQRACPAAKVKYLFGDDDFYVDANWWVADRDQWVGFATALSERRVSTPDQFGVQRPTP
ncbi:hypothetical protein RLEG12_18670 [Rhizobium leguminosarum bv. trifolii CB782]|nr:hypothetical protein RLEG12_18670 [Rhizobium leguminosarum bv. trifolii CB782]